MSQTFVLSLIVQETIGTEFVNSLNVGSSLAHFVILPILAAITCGTGWVVGSLKNKDGLHLKYLKEIKTISFFSLGGLCIFLLSSRLVLESFFGIEDSPEIFAVCLFVMGSSIMIFAWCPLVVLRANEMHRWLASIDTSYTLITALVFYTYILL